MFYLRCCLRVVVSDTYCVVFLVSNIYNNNKASNAKIGQNVNKAGFFFTLFRVNLVACFDSILPKYTSALLFSGINPSSERHREILLDAEV
jgi:hypothetical protein